MASSATYLPQFEPINATDTTNTIVTNLTNGTSSQKSIVVFAYMLSRGDDNSGATNFTFKDSTGAILWGPLNVLTQGNGNAMAVAEFQLGMFYTAPGADLMLAADQVGIIGGGVSYFYR